MDPMTIPFHDSNGNTIAFQWSRHAGVTASATTATGKIVQIAAAALPKKLRASPSESYFSWYLRNAKVDIFKDEDDQFRLEFHQNLPKSMLSYRFHMELANNFLEIYARTPSPSLSVGAASSSSPPPNRSALLIKLREHLHKINRGKFFVGNWRKCVVRYYGDKLYNLIQLYDRSRTLAEHYELLQIYLETILREGWFDQLEEAEGFFEQLINKKLFPDKIDFLRCYQSLISISSLLLSTENAFSLKIRSKDLSLFEKRNLTTSPFDEFFLSHNLEDSERKTVDLTFTYLFETTAALKKQKEKSTLPSIEHYPPPLRTALGNLFIEAMRSTPPSLWDIRHTYPNFFSSALSNPLNTPEALHPLWILFKGETSTTRTAILMEMDKNTPLESLIGRLTTLTAFQDFPAGDPFLAFSEYYLQTGVHSEWVDYVGGKAYFIVRREQNWCYLCNTVEGEMVNPGPLLDAKVLFSTPHHINLKVLKKDGWHLFNTTTGMEADSFDNIWFLCRKGGEIYLALKKDKKITIYNFIQADPIRTFTLAISIEMLAEGYFVAAIKFSDHVELWNIGKNIHIVPELPLKEVVKIPQTQHFVICRTLDCKSYLVDFEKQTFAPLPEGYSPLFGDHDSVYGKNSQGEPWTFNRNGFSLVDERYLREIEVYSSQSDLGRYAGIMQYGIGSFPSGVKYTFTVETQGNYNITKEAETQILWIESTLRGGHTLITTSGNIRFLGVSQHYRGEKGYFLIEEGSKKSLHISPYRTLKEAIDENKASKPQGRIIDLPENCTTVQYLHGAFLKIQMDDKWFLFDEEKGNGEIVSKGYDEIDYLDGIFFVKVRTENNWFLYGLERHYELEEPSTDIQLCSNNRCIALIGNHAVRYIDCRRLPEIIAPIRSDIEINGIPPHLKKNFLLNHRVISDILLDPHLLASVFRFLMMSTEHCLLKAISPSFLNKLIGIMAYFEETSSGGWEENIRELKSQIVTLKEQIEPLTERITALKEMNPSLQEEKIKLKKEVKSTESERGLLYTILRECRSKLNDQLQSDTLSVQASMWSLSKEIFTNHPHLWNGLLRYWIQEDPDGNSLPEFFNSLSHLIRLIWRVRTFCSEEFMTDTDPFSVINKHFIQIVKLYRFNPNLINNYMIGIARSDEVAHEILLTLNSLTDSEREHILFQKALEIGPSVLDTYETQTPKNREAVYGQLNQYIRLLMLIAIANELKFNEALEAIPLNQFNAGELESFTKAIASAIWLKFYQEHGILLSASDEKTEIPEPYLVHLMYAYSIMKKKNRNLLSLLLKCAVREFDFNTLIEEQNALVPIKSLFSQTEKVILNLIRNHTQEIRQAFLNYNIPWDIWRQGIGERPSSHFKVRIWKRTPAIDLFQGEYCGSCISMAKENSRASLSYLVNKNFSMIEILDKETKKIIGHVTIWMAVDAEKPGCVILVMNSFQIHRSYVEPSKRRSEVQINTFCEEIIHLAFNFALEFKEALNASRLIMGTCSHPKGIFKLLREVLDKEDVSSSLEASDSDEEESDSGTKIEQEIHPQIIGPVYGEEFYSDLFFSDDDFGWVTPTTTHTVDVYDIENWKKVSGSSPSSSLVSASTSSSSSS